MRELWKQIPLVLFTLLMPGIVFSYPMAVKGGFIPLAMLLVFGGVSLGMASFHLRRPTAAPLVMEHIRSSWFSREAVFFALFFPGIVLQIIFPETRNGIWTAIFFGVGLLGLGSTIMIYWQSPQVKKWSLMLQFISEAFFVGSLFTLLFDPTLKMLKANPDRLDQAILLILAVKVVKDLTFSGVRLNQDRGNLVWMATGVLALIGGIILAIEIISQTGQITWAFFWILGINSITMRLKLISRVEAETLKTSVVQAQKEYMPKKYQKYFSE